MNSFKSVYIFGVTPPQGRKFAREIVKQANLKSFEYIQYKDDEEGLDLNDLLLKNVNIQQRLISFTCKKQSYQNRCRS